MDCFCGIGPWNNRDRLLPYRSEDILALMDHFGIAQALVYSNMAARGGWAPSANSILTEMVRQEPRLLPAFTLAPHPYDDSPGPEDYASAMRQAGARAAWLWPTANRQTGGLWTWLLGDYLAMCCERRVPLFLNAEEIGFDDIHKLCLDFPELRLVLAGLGYGADAALFPLLRAHENVHVCLGHYYIPPGGPMRFLRHFPAERLLFGSGLPHFSPGGLIGHVMYAEISDEARDKILSGNMKRLLAEARP